MTMRRLSSAGFVGLLLTVAGVGMAAACGGQERCVIANPPAGAPPVDGGGVAAEGAVPWGYYVAEPAGWDGTTPLPTVLYFHGWNGSGAGAMAAANLSQSFTARGWLFVAADGRRKTWAHQGSPAHRDPQTRDEHAYTRAVLDDVARRYPIDPALRLAAGFSQGGSMVWDLACFQPDWFTAFAPVAGAFWEPLPPDCAPGPRRVRHVHGTADTVVPMAGRPIGETWHQGDVGLSLDRLLGATECRSDPSAPAPASDGTACQRVAACGSATRVDLCLHDGGHRRPAGWVAATLDWVESMAP